MANPFGILHRNNVVGITLQTVPWNLFFTGILLFSLGLRSSLASSIWTAPLRFFGNISYGLYLIHILIFVRYDDNIPRIANLSVRHALQGSFTRFFLAGGLSVLIAWLSRTFYEERFFRMGRRSKSEAARTGKSRPSATTIA